MSRHDDLQRVLDLGLVAIIRAPSGEQLVQVSEALLAGGIDVIEVTFTVPGILDILREIRAALGDRILLGAGTVLDAESARRRFLPVPSTSLRRPSMSTSSSCATAMTRR